MKIPRQPPATKQILSQVGAAPEEWLKILNAVVDRTPCGKYLHWDKLIYQKPPEGLSHTEWWLGIKIRRMALAKSIPLKATSGLPFTFCLIDYLLERLHDFDSRTHGTIHMPDEITNAETRSRYVVRSLIEESITSSQLEGASTTREVAKEMIRQGRAPKDRSEQMILNNYRTMQKISRVKSEKLSRELLFDLHRMVTEDMLDDPSRAGRFRSSEESIGVYDVNDELLHMPPDASQLDQRLSDMCDFANGVTPSYYVPPAIRSIILHFWLAYDHPFIDGNGRTARALFYWSMLHHGFWLFEFISISQILVRAPARYGRAFLHTETDENDLTYFIVHQADVIERSIEKLHEYIKEKTRIISKLQAKLKGMLSLNYRQKDLISHALKNPGHSYTYESHKVSHGIVHQTARTDLLDLEERDVLKKRKIGRVWHFTPVRDLESRMTSF